MKRGTVPLFWMTWATVIIIALMFGWDPTGSHTAPHSPLPPEVSIKELVSFRLQQQLQTYEENAHVESITVSKTQIPGRYIVRVVVHPDPDPSDPMRNIGKPYTVKMNVWRSPYIFPDDTP